MVSVNGQRQQLTFNPTSPKTIAEYEYRKHPLYSRRVFLLKADIEPDEHLWLWLETHRLNTRIFQLRIVYVRPQTPTDQFHRLLSEVFGVNC